MFKNSRLFPGILLLHKGKFLTGTPSFLSALPIQIYLHLCTYIYAFSQSEFTHPPSRGFYWMESACINRSDPTTQRLLWQHRAMVSLLTSSLVLWLQIAAHNLFASYHADCVAYLCPVSVLADCLYVLPLFSSTHFSLSLSFSPCSFAFWPLLFVADWDRICCQHRRRQNRPRPEKTNRTHP